MQTRKLGNSNLEVCFVIDMAPLKADASNRS
jgi:hypothetical protein